MKWFPFSAGLKLIQGPVDRREEKGWSIWMAEFHYLPQPLPPRAILSSPILRPLPVSLVGQTMARWQWSPEPPPPRPLITGHCPNPWLSRDWEGQTLHSWRGLGNSAHWRVSASGLNWSRHWLWPIKDPLPMAGWSPAGTLSPSSAPLLTLNCPLSTSYSQVS